MKARTLVMGCFVALFFLMVLFPLWGRFFPQPESDSLDENRNLTEWDQTGSLRDRIENAEAYLNDHLAFRESAISLALRADLDLGESPVSMVLSGFDGWLFYLEGEEDFRRGSGLDSDTVRELYNVQQKNTDVFRAAGADYRILVAPDKHSVYPGYLPISKRLGSGPWELDQMMASPGPEYSVRFLDVRSPLLDAAQAKDLQYYKTDSHWNAAGAWTAYQAMMDQLSGEHPSLHRLTEADVVRSTVTTSGDLAAMIGQRNLRVDFCENIAVREFRSREAPDMGGSVMDVFVNDSLPDAPKMLLIKDSFGPALIPFLRESVSELYVMSNEAPSFAVMGDLSRFDIVVMEVVERNRYWLWSGFDAGGEYDEEGYEEDYGEEYGGDSGWE